MPIIKSHMHIFYRLARLILCVAPFLSILGAAHAAETRGKIEVDVDEEMSLRLKVVIAEWKNTTAIKCSRKTSQTREIVLSKSGKEFVSEYVSYDRLRYDQLRYNQLRLLHKKLMSIANTPRQWNEPSSAMRRAEADALERLRKFSDRDLDAFDKMVPGDVNALARLMSPDEMDALVAFRKPSESDSVAFFMNQEGSIKCMDFSNTSREILFPGAPVEKLPKSLKPALALNQPSMMWPDAYRPLWREFQKFGSPVCELGDANFSCGWITKDDMLVLSAELPDKGAAITGGQFKVTFGKSESTMTVRMKICRFFTRGAVHELVEGATTQLLRVYGDCRLESLDNIQLVDDSSGSGMAIKTALEKSPSYNGGDDHVYEYELRLENIPRPLPNIADWRLEGANGAYLGRLTVSKWRATPVRSHRIRYAFEDLQSVAGGAPSMTDDNERIAVTDPTFQPGDQSWGVVNDFYLELPLSDKWVWFVKGNESVQLVSYDDMLVPDQYVPLEQNRLSVRIKPKHIGPVSVTVQLRRGAAEVYDFTVQESAVVMPSPDVGQVFNDSNVLLNVDVELASSARRESVPHPIIDDIVLECGDKVGTYQGCRGDKNNCVIAPSEKALEKCTLFYHFDEIQTRANEAEAKARASGAQAKAANAKGEAYKAQKAANEAQLKAYDAQMKANEARVKAYEAQMKASEAQMKADQAWTAYEGQVEVDVGKASDAKTKADQVQAKADQAMAEADLARKMAYKAQVEAEQTQEKANDAKAKADQAKAKADQAQAEADQAKARADKLGPRGRARRRALYGPQSITVEVQSSRDAAPKRFYWGVDPDEERPRKSLRPLLPKDLSQPGNTITVTAVVRANRRTVAYRANTVAAVSDAVDLVDDQYVFTARLVPRGRFSYDELSIRTYATIPVSIFGVRMLASSRSLESSTSETFMERVNLRTGLLFVVEPWNYKRRENLWAVPVKLSAGALWATGDNDSFAPSLVAGVSASQPLIDAPTQFGSSFSLSAFYEWDTSRGGGRHVLLLFSADLFSVLSPKAE